MTVVVERDLIELAERCERLTGPCRETDAQIWWHVERARAERVYWNAAPGKPYPLEGEMPSDMGRLAVSRFAPAYTGSIDAAMTLGDPGAEISISTLYGVARVEYPLNFADHLPHSGEHLGGLIAPAICAAILRARASMKGEG